LAERHFYLETVTLEKAQEIWRQAWRELDLGRRLPVLRLATEEALGYTTAEPVFAAVSSPHYHAAAMDGLAVCARDTYGASERAPLRLSLPGQGEYVNTGDPLPEGRDAVIMVEELSAVEGKEVEITAPAVPWQYVRMIGEDVVASEMLLPRGQRVRAVDIGALLAGGVLEVAVKRPPRVAVIPTGEEITEPGEPLVPGRIVDFNSRMLSAFLAEWQAEVTRLRPVADSEEAIADAVRGACEERDLVLVLAGASAGSRDFTPGALKRCGRVLVHGLATRPAKPTLLATVEGKPVIGVPGYPVSAAFCYEWFVQPLVCHMLGISPPVREKGRAVISRKVTSPAGSEEFLRVRLGRVSGRLIATPVARGAGLIFALARADGVIRIAAESEGLQAEEETSVELYRPRDEIERRIVIVGSHDLALDLLADQLSADHPGLGLSSTHVGSMAGLTALKKGQCHLAGCHLLDEASGEYNLRFVRELFGEAGLHLITLAHREQGLMVRPGNPRQIRGWADLARPEISFINRQPGAGTRLLLDYHLKEHSISPERVNGYRREVFTHLAVAAAVAGGSADTGLGLLAAARALGLDFIPLARERYDLVIPEAHFRSEKLQRFLSTLRSQGFKGRLASLGGYDTSETGKEVG
jgi:putative molybdopterin biosynthesis protein